MLRDLKAIVLAGLSVAGGMIISRKDIELIRGSYAGEGSGGSLKKTEATVTKRSASGRSFDELPIVGLHTLQSVDVESISVPLRSAGSVSRKSLSRSSVFEAELAKGDETQPELNPGIVLLRKRGGKEVLALRTAPGEERAAAERLMRRGDIEFASVDTIQSRQFTPTDANLNFQWHHSIVDSFGAWEHGLGNRQVTVAIVDTPFQMNHPDLIDNVEAGWDVTDEMPILTSAGDAHSTASAGMAAAVINNGLGVAGAANSRIVPVGITGATSEMYQAVLWAADRNIRVVNISWTGADEPVLQAAGEYLEGHAQGVLVMPGLNNTGQAGFENHPHIICVSMTDAADNARSLSGPHIDFAAPGWDVFTTTTNSMYAVARGTSFAAPFFSGVAAMVMSINPALTAAAVVEVMQTTADDRGNSGWDESYGWGRVNFRAAVEKTVTTLPRITGISVQSGQIEIAVETKYPARLVLEQKVLELTSAWTGVSEATSSTSPTVFEVSANHGGVIYRVRAEGAAN